MPKPPTIMGSEGQKKQQFTEQAAYDKYFLQGYNYCDAEILGAFWGKNAEQSKVRLGRKMLQSGPEAGATMLEAARTQARKKNGGNLPCS